MPINLSIMRTRREPGLSALVLVMVMVVVALMLFTIISRTATVDRDAVRYLQQARGVLLGDGFLAVRKAVDHPLYPSLIALVHVVRGADRYDAVPKEWQRSAQITSAIAGILLVIPVFASARLLAGPTAAWIAVGLTFFTPAVNHLLADGLSEALFLLAWTSGLTCALKYLRDENAKWLAPMLAFTVLAFWTRPEGALLPLALGATLLVIPWLPTARMVNRRDWRLGAGIVLAAPLLAVIPLLIVKGNLATKPAIARVLGTATPAASLAVERSQPADPNATPLQRWGEGVKVVGESLRDAVGLPTLLLALAGVFPILAMRYWQRTWILVAIILIMSFVALVRLHVTAGYCAPRHTMIPALLLFVIAARGLRQCVDVAVGWIEARRGAPVGAWVRCATLPTILLIWCLAQMPGALKPLHEEFQGYYEAGVWLRSHTPPDSAVVDLIQLSQFHAGRGGYWFGNYPDAAKDPQVRYVVTRRAHLVGPWDYCRFLQTLVGDRQPIAEFPAAPRPGQSRVWIFDLKQPPTPAPATATEAVPAYAGERPR